MEDAYANPAAVHPIRRALPRPAPLVGRPDRREDVRLFLMTFVAGFIAFYGLIA